MTHSLESSERRWEDVFVRACQPLIRRRGKERMKWRREKGQFVSASNFELLLLREILSNTSWYCERKKKEKNVSHEKFYPYFSLMSF